MNIAFLADDASANGWYRAIYPMQALAALGHNVRLVAAGDPASRVAAVHGCDIVHIHRQHDERARAIMQYARRTGMPVIWDNDDDLGSLPETNVGSRRFRGLTGRRVIAAQRKMALEADVVTTPSSRLADMFRHSGVRDVRVIENYLRDDVMFLRRGERHDRLVIGWVAGLEHHLDSDQIPIAAALGSLLVAHRHVEVRTVGVRLPIRHERYTHTVGYVVGDLAPAVAEFDVGLAPLIDIPFNLARSNLKLKEYAGLGIPWLASPIGPYAAMGRREGGRLVPDSMWPGALERIVRRRGERRRMARRAGRWGATQTIGQNVTQWEQLMLELINRKR
ncbi:hypothetical protein [Conexibacter sp. CPCC 206217]|uniref:hypothetical protein n=1 Tax=Conexibacter sp. CPCC 206217 TaxID=3064574 RepID=UPI00271E0706|nr:hypothetical protein [Conexibacter sp. CPCC 206217]MDO8209891.1 hypothetical protein [Conexibacter sp. CPCC 206217]